MPDKCFDSGGESRGGFDSEVGGRAEERDGSRMASRTLALGFVAPASPLLLESSAPRFEGFSQGFWRVLVSAGAASAGISRADF
jgi:hypothetical protein